jgi:hypothetical protein
MFQQIILDFAASAYFGHSRHPIRAITRHRIGRNPASVA